MITYLVDSSYPAKRIRSTLLWEKLSNSGDILKLIVPNYCRRAVCGWTNHSCKVISYKMRENEMDYRGSKSEFQIPQPKEIYVKEQRVDGSCFGFSPKLRCTLMDRENSYQVNNLSKRLNNKQFSTLTQKSTSLAFEHRAPCRCLCPLVIDQREHRAPCIWASGKWNEMKWGKLN